MIRSHHSHFSAAAVLLAATAFFLCARWLERHAAKIEPVRVHRAIFRDVGGLAAGARVRYDGVDVGRVLSISLTRRGALVTLALVPSLDVGRMDEWSIQAPGLSPLSRAIVSIHSTGPAGAVSLPECVIVRGRPPVDVESTLRRVDQLAVDFEGATRTLTREVNANRLALSAAVTSIATLASELAGIAAEDRSEVHRTLTALASIAAKADASRIVESVDLLTDQLARLLPAITRDTGAILATGAQLATTASAVLAQVTRARKAAARLKVGATSTTLVKAHGRRLESDLRGTVDVGATRYSLGWESGTRGGLDALARHSFDGGWSFETGTLRGAPAIGLGAFDGHLMAEAFRVPTTELRLTGTAPITDRWAVVCRLDDVTRSDRRELLLGAEARW